VQHSLAAVVARFRLMPPQACDNLFILDFIARRSAHEVVDEDGRPGWALCFDPHFSEKFTASTRSRSSRRRIALVRGARSQLLKEADADYLMSFCPPGSPHIEIPEADHHVMIDQPLAFVAALRALLSAWP
jgi:pimeloyl-ACP methyl ester carboxylesterase